MMLDFTFVVSTMCRLALSSASCTAEVSLQSTIFVKAATVTVVVVSGKP